MHHFHHIRNCISSSWWALPYQIFSYEEHTIYSGRVNILQINTNSLRTLTYSQKFISNFQHRILWWIYANLHLLYELHSMNSSENTEIIPIFHGETLPASYYLLHSYLVSIKKVQTYRKLKKSMKNLEVWRCSFEFGRILWFNCHNIVQRFIYKNLCIMTYTGSCTPVKIGKPIVAVCKNLVLIFTIVIKALFNLI